MYFRPLLLALILGLCACGDDRPTDVPDADATDVDAADADVSPDDTGDGETTDAAEDGSGDTTPVGEGLFAEGCPVDGRSTVRQIGVDAHFDGVGALGGEGDYLLMNEHAAFVIQDVRYAEDPDNEVHTWWYYGGQPIDAVALDGCAQAGPERFMEMGVVLIEPNIAQFEASNLRGFRADTVEIISDGANGGPAHLRASGTDDRFWLIEYELVKRAFSAGSPRALSEPFGGTITVDYYLEPDTAVLTMDVSVSHGDDDGRTLVSGLINFFGNDVEVTRFNRSELDLGGLRAPLGIPWLVGTSRVGSWLVAMADAAPATFSVSGVDALFDSTQFFDGTIAAGASRTDRYLFAVGDAGINSATRWIHDVLPEPTEGMRFTPAPLRVSVTDTVSGAPLPGIEVVVERRNDVGDWRVIDGFYTAEDGIFDGEIPNFVGARETRLRVFEPGRPATEPVLFVPGVDTDVDFELAPGGQLVVDVYDGDERRLPARVTVWNGDRRVALAYHGVEDLTLDLPPGDYELIVSRGYEYPRDVTPITIAAEEAARHTATLERVVDTSGFMAMDGHIHAGPSPDSRVNVPDRLLSLAAAGLEIAVSSDHEAIVSWAPEIEPAGLAPWIRTVLGSEVTATLPEHSNAYPFPERVEHPRGEPVRWYGEGVGGLFAASRDRGAQVVALNHPRQGCNYMCLVDYDRISGEANLDDPTALGFAPGTPLWSWDFDTIEYMNGHGSPFVDPERPDTTGHFEDWMSFHNHGHRITATGVTDIHGFDYPGSPVNFFETPTDDPVDFTDQQLVDAMLGGRALVSAGAFARIAVNDGGLGDTVTLVEGSGDLSVRVEAIPEIDVTEVLVFANCDEILRIDTTDPDGVVKLDTTVRLELAEDAHIVVLGFGQDPLPRPFPNYDASAVPRFTTNPIFVDADGDGVFTPPGGKTCTYSLPTARKDADPRPDPTYAPATSSPDLRATCHAHEH